MPDRLLRAQVVIPNDNALPEDSFINVFHFDADDGNSEEECLDAIKLGLTNFYGQVGPAIMSSHAGDNATVKYYDMRDAKPRQPLRTDTFALTVGGTAPYPNEVALCVSFSADVASGEKAARKRGRVFIGPIGGQGQTTTGGETRPTTTTLDTIATAAGNMAQGLDVTIGSVKWAVFSPTMLATGSTIDEAFNDVTHGWIDNAFDTQRRRGAAATARRTWTD